MAKDLTGTTAATGRMQAFYRLVYLVEIDADAPDVGVTVKRYGSRQYTLSGNAYADALVGQIRGGFQVGISPRMATVKQGGGLAAVAGFGVTFRNEDKLSHLQDTYFLENDEVRVYVIFSTGAEVSGDKIQLLSGVIENFPFDLREWAFDVIDGSDRDFREIPGDRVDLVTYPFAPFDALGKVVPAPFGSLNKVPAAQVGEGILLAPCRCVDQFAQIYTAGGNLDAFGVPYQYYSADRRFAEILNYTRCDKDGAASGTDIYFKVNDGTRKMVIYPGAPMSSNDQATWYKVADDNSSTSVTIGTTANLDVYFGGMGKAGTLTAASIKLLASGTFAYTIKLGGSILTSGTSTGNSTLSLASYLANWDDDWDFQALSIELAGSGGDATISLVWLEISYSDQGVGQSASLDLHQAVSGAEDVAAQLRDGAVIVSAGQKLTNPVHQLQYLLRAKALYNRPVAQVNTTSFAAADDYRTGWIFDFPLHAVASLNWLSEFCFQAGLHLFKDFMGKWKVVAQDKTRPADHTWIWNWNMAAKPGSKEPDARFSRTPIREIVNEVALRYQLNPATGEYQKLKIRSPQYRYTGTCSTSSSTGRLVDASGTFLTGAVPARVGETVYITNDQEYLVDSVVSDTQLAVSVKGGGAITDQSGITYYAGPNLSGTMLRSAQRYKTENPLGSPLDPMEDQGGYPSEFIADDDTADAFLDRMEEQRSQRLLMGEIATFMNAVDVELGDVGYLVHPWIPVKRQPVQLGALLGSVNSAATSWTLNASTWGGADSWRVDDRILVDWEIVKVTAKDDAADTVTVSRAQANTLAAAHTAGAALYRITRKWEVTGHQWVPASAQFRLQVQEMPHDYVPVGIAVADGYPNASAATAAQLLSSGWAAHNSGRVFEEDEDSNYSHAGAD